MLHRQLSRRTYRLRSFTEKDRGNMPCVEIVRHVSGDDDFVGLEQVCVSPAHPCGHFESHVQQLAKTAVVSRLCLIMAQGSHVLAAAPTANFARQRKLR